MNNDIVYHLHMFTSPVSPIFVYLLEFKAKKMLNVGADWGEICLYVNISFLLIRELDLFIVQVNEIISVIPVNVNTTCAYVRYISACI